MHTVVGRDGKRYSIASIISDRTGHLRRQRVHGRTAASVTQLCFGNIGLDPRGLLDPGDEDIVIRRKEFIYFPMLLQNSKCLLVGQILCFIHSYMAKGASYSQQLFKASSVDDEAWMKVFLVSPSGVLSPAPFSHQKVAVKLVNTLENKADVRQGRIDHFDSSNFKELTKKLWAPLERLNAEAEQQQEIEKEQRLKDFTYPIDKMETNELWLECRARLNIEDNSELFEVIKRLENQLTLSFGLNENTNISKTRLKGVLRLLRRNKVKLSQEEAEEMETQENPPPS